MSSRLVPLQLLCLNIATWNPQTKAPDDTFSYIDIASIDRAEKRITEAIQCVGRNAPSRARQLVKEGDVLVSTVRPNLNAVAIVPASLAGATASTGFTVLRSDAGKLYNRYLFHWVKNPFFVAQMTSRATGASYPAVTDSIVKNSCIPLPPLAEQKRIAAILDEADALRRKRREAIAKLDTLSKSVFLEMFGDPATNPKGWKVSSLEALCYKITDGVHKTPNYIENGIPFVTVKNITSGKVDLLDCKHIHPDEHRELCLRTKPERGDLLVSKDGTIGVPCLVDTSEEFSIFVSVALLKLKTAAVSPGFLFNQFKSDGIQSV